MRRYSTDKGADRKNCRGRGTTVKKPVMEEPMRRKSKNGVEEGMEEDTRGQEATNIATEEEVSAKETERPETPGSPEET